MALRSHKITEPYAQIPTTCLPETADAQIRHKITEPYAQIPTRQLKKERYILI